MKKKISLAFAMLVALACLWATSAFAMGTDISVANADVNLREGPSTEYAKITTIPAGSQVYILDADVNGWTRVEYEGDTGFVASKYLGNKLDHEGTSGYGSGDAGFAQYAVSDDVNLRIGPGKAFEVLTVVPAGAEVGVSDYGNGWAHCWYGNYEGYIYMEYIPALAHIHSGHAQGTAYKVSDAVNLRKGPGVGYGRVTVVPAGESVTVEDFAYGWAHVRYGDKEGYIYMKYIPDLKYAMTPGDSPEGDMTWYGGYDYGNVYDEEYYAANQPDVVKAVGKDPKALIKHFVNYGIYEGRQAKEDFNVNTYRSMHPELQERFGSDLHLYYLYACNIIY